ncbi:hypothetical protein [Haliangium ochraceum]|uniref:Putative lipoprotein n=1 Tax=Haliangium ochraceum (strain DSM 14365 / JCM 11303 / SMP-2) TaxID=502025 RepID=D0LXF0_HALO1|nr:hypothetical protein [Haliangium ochraceum]ACY17705.1 putative lipoprotein [Haliangium ochraceum DSM 14365]
MKRFAIGSLLLGALSLGISGCVVRSHNHPSHGHPKAKSGGGKKHHNCRPSHYWDGHKCRHKGKGKGARKHDY